MPSVSVVMSVYNDADRVEYAVESILNQTFTDFEFIAVDDGSVDKSGEALDSFAKQDHRIRLLRQPNSGLTRSLIEGCRAARGEFIARQDADDWSAPERLAEQVTLLSSHADAGFVSCTTDYIGPDDELLETVHRPITLREATDALLYRRQGPPAHGSVMFRRALYERIGGYRAEFYYAQDSDLWLRFGERSHLGYCPRRLYRARREINSISGSQRELQMRFGELGHACREARIAGKSEGPFLAEAQALTTSILNGRRSSSTAQASELDMAYLLGSQLVRHGDRRGAKYLWQVLRQRPWHWKAWARMAQSLASRKPEVDASAST